MGLLFIESRYTPIDNGKSWAVPPARYSVNYSAKNIEQDIASLDTIGLVENEDYRIVRFYSGDVKRIEFLSDSAFVYAKMMMS